MQAVQNFSDFDDLDALLTEAQEHAKNKAHVTSIRKQVKEGKPMTNEESRAANEAVRRWEEQNEWRATANVATFHHYTCNCGNVMKVFAGLTQRQVHRHLKNGAERWVKVDAASAALPNDVKVLAETEIPMCGKCAEGKGYVV